MSFDNIISKNSAAAKQTFFRLMIDCSEDQNADTDEEYANCVVRKNAENMLGIRKYIP